MARILCAATYNGCRWNRWSGHDAHCAAGGYQAYVLPGMILSLLRHVTGDVQVVLPCAASKLVSVYAVEVASRHKVYVEMEEEYLKMPKAWLARLSLLSGPAFTRGYAQDDEERVATTA